MVATTKLQSAKKYAFSTRSHI